MNNKIKQEINNIHIPKELHNRSKIGILNAKSEMQNRRENHSKLLYFLALAACLLILIPIGLSQFHLHYQNVSGTINESDFPTIQKDLTKFLNKHDDKNLNPKLKKIVTLGSSDTYVGLFKTDTNEIGIAIFKGLSDQEFRIIQCKYGTSRSNYYGVQTTKANYGIISGVNIDNKIGYIKVKLIDNSYAFKVKVPEQSYFVIVNELPKGVSANKFGDLYFYDKKDAELPKSFYLLENGNGSQ